MNPIALERIEKNKRSQSKTLNLRKLALERVPTEIADFIWLEELYLDQNQIAKIEGLDRLAKLNRLDLDQNQIAKIEGLDKLLQLQQLYLDQNQIAKIEGLDKLLQLQQLYLYQNQIAKIEGLDKLLQLQILNLDQNQIAKIEGLDKLLQLQQLYLYQNQIAKIEGLDKLLQLQQLYLDQNQIAKIEGLDKLLQLQILYLSQNQIAKIEGLDKLLQLQILNLSQNQIAKIEGLDKLLQLQILNLDQNQIAKIEGLDKLLQLQILNLDQNQIAKIEGLDKLLQLQILNLDQNQIAKIEDISALTRLKVLDLSANLFQDLSPLTYWLQHSDGEIFVKDLEFEWLSKPKESKAYLSIKYDLGLIGILYFVTQKGLYLQNNPQLKLPSPEWIQLGKKVVLDYLNAARENGTVEMNEAKVMIVGRPHSGKTSLSTKLRDSGAPLPLPTDSTKGIAVENWIYEIDDIKFIAYLWDFGGQDIQYAIHQFFMTQRAIYLLVDCTRDPEIAHSYFGESSSEIISNYWMQTIQNLAESSPTFYIYNLYKPYSKNPSIFHNLERQYGNFLHKYPLEVDLNQVSQQHEQEIQSVREKLQSAIAELPNVGLVLPKKWAAIKEILNRESEQHSFITLKEYYKICEGNGVNDPQSALLISRYFHEIGSIIHYSEDETSTLFKLIILKRKWATEATYQIILDQHIEQRQAGRFTQKDLKRIWINPEYRGMTAELLELLLKFEICYELPDSDPKTYLIPQCLPASIPEGVDHHKESPISIRYNYDFLPYGIVNRLTVRLHTYIQKDLLWKQGVVLEKGEGRALVEEVKTLNKGFLRITISGNKEERWYLQRKLMEDLDDLNTKMNLGEVVDIQVPCICETCKERKSPHLHDYQKLVEMLKESIEEERCGLKPFKMVSILDLIDHAFFSRPKAVEQSLHSKLDFRGAHIDKIVIGESHEKTQHIEAGRKATVQVSGGEGQNVIEQPEMSSHQHLWEYFRLRKLIGWTVGAIGILIISYFIPILRPWSGLIFTALLGWGTFTSLTADSTYLRYSKWVLLIGLGASGILNGLPVIAGNITGQLGNPENSFIRFMGQYRMDEQPWVTIVILVLTFVFSTFLVHKDK